MGQKDGGDTGTTNYKTAHKPKGVMGSWSPLGKRKAMHAARKFGPKPRQHSERQYTLDAETTPSMVNTFEFLCLPLPLMASFVTGRPSRTYFTATSMPICTMMRI